MLFQGMRQHFFLTKTKFGFIFKKDLRNFNLNICCSKVLNCLFAFLEVCMAIIAISRQVAALGDEVASRLSEKLNYRFINRKEIEERILKLGFKPDKLKKYDEKKPGFFASLVKERDEYLDYLQTAILDAASEGNCILIGRGAFAVLASLPNLLSLRFVASNEVRLERLKKEFNWNDKLAQCRIDESDMNRRGFHKSFFNIDIDDPTQYMAVLNTGIFDVEKTSDAIKVMVEHFSTPEIEKEGLKKLSELQKCQHLVNKLIFNHKIKIEFLRAVMEDNVITLQGVADSSVLVEKALNIARTECPGFEIKSSVSVIQDFKAY